MIAATDLFSRWSAGFRGNRATTEKISDIASLEEVSGTRNPAHVVSLDMCNAFDHVLQDAILFNLRYY